MTGLCEPEPQECHLYPPKTTGPDPDRALHLQLVGQNEDQDRAPLLQLVEENEVVRRGNKYGQDYARQGKDDINFGKFAI